MSAYTIMIESIPEMNKMFQLMHLYLLTLTDIPRHMFRRCKSPSSGGRLVWSSLNHPFGSAADSSASESDSVNWWVWMFCSRNKWMIKWTSY
jgi:hypothetical protein